MGKITVKHYLNTSVQPEIINNINHYPVYIRITINRKSTQYRSITGHKLSENDFNNYINGNNYSCDFSKYGIFDKEYFENEPIRIQKAFEFFINQCAFEQFNKRRFDFIWSWISGVFLMWTENGLINFMWGYTITSIDKEKMYSIFNKECSLVECLKNLNKYFGVDIKSQIHPIDMEVWENTELLLKHINKKNIFIDFVCNYREIIGKIKGIKNKENFIAIIKEVTEKFYEYSW